MSVEERVETISVELLCGTDGGQRVGLNREDYEWLVALARAGAETTKILRGGCALFDPRAVMDYYASLDWKKARKAVEAWDKAAGEGTE
jgi:hypothetical protein